MTRLEARLASLARSGQTIGYGALAAELGLRIRDLTDALESLMEQDHANGLPLRAALCTGRLSAGLPARGFFDKALALGCPGAEDPVSFTQMQRKQLFDTAQSCA